MLRKELKIGTKLNVYRKAIHCFGLSKEDKIFKKEIEDIRYFNLKPIEVKFKGGKLWFNIAGWEDENIKYFYNNKIQWFIKN